MAQQTPATTTTASRLRMLIWIDSRCERIEARAVATESILLDKARHSKPNCHSARAGLQGIALLGAEKSGKGKRAEKGGAEKGGEGIFYFFKKVECPAL